MICFCIEFFLFWIDTSKTESLFALGILDSWSDNFSNRHSLVKSIVSIVLSIVINGVKSNSDLIFFFWFKALDIY